MADTYLPADVRKRIVDVMRERKMTQRELALRIDVNESTISRFLSGKTEKLSEESVIRIARVFNVSTDFILGTTVIPDKKNYDISELGLSVEAAKNLYTGKVNNDVVNRLLENPRFATVTYKFTGYCYAPLIDALTDDRQQIFIRGRRYTAPPLTPTCSVVCQSYR